LYSKDDLIDQQVIVVVNLFPKKIGPFISDCLVTGFYKENKKVVLAAPGLLLWYQGFLYQKDWGDE